MGTRARAAAAVLVAFVAHLSTPGGACLAQCTDADLDTYFREDGCGTAVDCNDADAAIHPGAAETCNGFDDDCNRLLDDDAACDGTCEQPANTGPDRWIRPEGEDDYLRVPSLAWTGNGYGVAFQASAGRLLFVPVDANGEPSGSEVTFIDNGEYNASPFLAWTGQEYGVLFERIPTGCQHAVYFVRLDADGNPIGAEVSLTQDCLTDSRPAAVEWNGREFAVIYNDTGDHAMFLRVDESGQPVGEAVEVARGLNEDLVWDGEGYGLTYREAFTGELWFARLTAEGSPIGSPSQLNHSNQEPGESAVTWNGNGYGAVWVDRVNPANWEIHFARIDAGGQAIGDDTRVSFGTGDSGSPAIIWTGDEYGVFWHDDRDFDGTAGRELYFRRIAVDGSLPGPEIRMTSGDWANTPDAAWNGEAFGVAWAESARWPTGIFFTRWTCNCGDGDGDGTGACLDCDDNDPDVYPGAEQLCCDATNNDCDSSLWPALTGTNEHDNDGDGYTECEGDCNDGDPSSYPGAPDDCNGIDEDCSGQPDDGGGCLRTCTCGERDASDLQAGDRRREGSITSVVWNGSEYGVGYEGFEYLYFRRLSAGNDPVGDEVFLTGWQESNNVSEMIWTGTDYALTYTRLSDLASDEIVLIRLDETGAETAEFVLSEIDGVAVTGTSVVWNGTGFAIGFTTFDEGVRLARLDAAGALLGGIVPVSVPVRAQRPSLAWNGSGYALAWNDVSTGKNEVWLRRHDPAGDPIAPPRQITSGARDAENPFLLWTGTGYAIAWQASTDAFDREVLFQRLAPDGTPVGTATLVGTADVNGAKPKLVFTGEEFGMTWDDRFARLDAGGAVVEGPVPVPLDPWPDPRQDAGVAWSGQQYTLAWWDGRLHGPETFVNLFTNQINCHDELDDDLDTWSECLGDCDDTDPATYPGAPQVCDGTNNDCSDPFWPEVPTRELDEDLDGYRPCEGDCADHDRFRNPGATEVCNGLDDDCDGLTDEDLQGEDPDGDSVGNLCDNCPALFNPEQSDLDLDGEGDVCDVNDGLIFVHFDVMTRYDWQVETGFDAWNAYRGDLSVLKDTGVYTQAPGSNPLAKRECDLVDPWMDDPDSPGPGEAACYLTSGISGGVEGGLGSDSAGTPRPNDNPCP